MPSKTTKVFAKLLNAFNSGVRRIVSKGGTSSGKTVAHMQLLLEIAINRQKSGVLISVVSETLPHLKQGAIRDFVDELKRRNFIEGLQYQHANHVYTFGLSTIEFFSADSGKATGPRRDILYLNECNNMKYSVVTELEQRTRETIFYDFNPLEPFWIEDKVLALPDRERVLLRSNYLDNDQLEQSIRHEIELKASRDENYKRVHIDVEYGVSEGLIFPNWSMVDDMPKAERRIYGMDFGYTNDPTTLIDVQFFTGGLYADELLWKTGLHARDIIDELRAAEVSKTIVADSEDPRMISELSMGGFHVVPAIKGPGSIKYGIDAMKRQPLFVTKRSVNLIKELRNYRYKIDKAGNTLNEPVDNFNHGLDAWRYPVSYLEQQKMHTGALRSNVISRRRTS